jgi:hypothetical protein
MNETEDDFTHELFKTDILKSLYEIFDSVEEKMIVNGKKLVFQYKVVNDTENFFFMVSNENLQKIIGKFSPKRIL